MSTATETAGARTEMVLPLGPRPSAFNQWAALTGRLVRSLVASGDLLNILFIPAMFTLGFYLPLHQIMRTKGLDYAQFLMPIIVLQTLSFTMLLIATLAAVESSTGMAARLKSMPIRSSVPLVARQAVGLGRCTLMIFSALGFGYLIGFRFVGGWRQALLFIGIALVTGLVLALFADALGSYTSSPAAVGQSLTLPTLILGMLSSGFVPIQGFPEWVQPFVRNQPVSQISTTLRELASNTLSFHTAIPTIAWLGGGLVIAVPLAIWVDGRHG